MRIVEISALSNGAHRNQTAAGAMSVPAGWAVIPEGLETPGFPFGTVTAREQNGEMTVTAWAAGQAPQWPDDPEPEPTVEDVSLELLADHEERICLLELTI